MTGGAFGLQDAEAQHAAAYRDARAAVEGADATAKLAVVVRALPLQPRASAIYLAAPRQCHITLQPRASAITPEHSFTLVYQTR